MFHRLKVLVALDCVLVDLLPGSEASVEVWVVFLLTQLLVKFLVQAVEVLGQELLLLDDAGDQVCVVFVL